MGFEVPDSCTLPTVARPLRLAEFEELFATAVRGVERVTVDHVRMSLTGPAGLAETVRDLTARETECCSFFSFSLTVQPGTAEEVLTLDVRVPAGYTEVLDSLAQRAAGAAGATSASEAAAS